jgi:sirohydrochlorin cobaltochelatase
VKAILIVGHGSRSINAQKEFDKILEIVSQKSKNIVKGCHMELCSPNISEAMVDLVENHPEVDEIEVLPLFLFEGIHIKKTIPELMEQEREKYPNVKIFLKKHLGADELIADLLLKRAEE